jgi:methionine-rich copper-binding protein CopC
VPTFSLETRRRAALGLLAGLVLATVGTAAGAASPALAHDYIVSSSPADNETVTEPIQAVSMTFNNELLNFEGAVAMVTVTDVDDGHHESGCVTVDGTTVSTDVALGEAGEYTVTWQVTSSDGHPTKNSYTFTWQPSMPTATTTAMTTAPACGDDWAGSAEAMAAGSDDSTSTPPATPGAAPLNSLPEPTMTILNSAPVGQTDASPLSVPLLVAGLVGVVAALIAVVVIVMRRMRHS